jgi:farnesyl-diphosphate synthase (EC 2.5.1.10)
MAAATAPHAPSAEHAALDHYGKAIGLAFQIQDDVLDVESSTAQLGKTQGKDAAQGKSTYVALMGLDAARARAGELFDEACDALAPLAGRADDLIALAESIRVRNC